MDIVIPTQTETAVLALFVAVLAIVISVLSWRVTRLKNIREATEAVFKEWWGDDMKKLRAYFREEFLPNRQKLQPGTSMKEVEDVLGADEGRLNKYCYFFDRVGWLAAAGLVNIDYLIAPMQHLLRRTWFATEPLILREREQRPGRPFDPVFYYGFEWLFRRSSGWYGRQPMVLWRIGLIPRWALFRVRALSRDIVNDENAFVASLKTAPLGAPAQGRPTIGPAASSRLSRVVVFYLKNFLLVLVCFAFAWVAVRLVGLRWPVLVSSSARTAAFLLGSALLVGSAIGRLGYRIRSWDGDSAAERLDRALFRTLSLLGIFLLVFDFLAGKFGN